MLFGQLIQIVEELLHEHKKFLVVTEQKKQALIKGDIEKIQQIMKGEVQFVRKVESLEQKRIQYGKQIADHFHLPLEDLTASKLVELDPDKERAAKFHLLTGKFVKVIGELKAANELNGKLIQQSLEMVQQTIDLLADIQDAGLYSDKGDSDQGTGGQKSFFDTKA